MVCQDTEIRKCPAKHIMDEQDSGILVGTGDVRLVVGKGSLLAKRLSVPFEA